MIRIFPKITLLVCGILLIQISQLYAKPVHVNQGISNLTSALLNKDGYVKLDGTWAFYWSKLYSPSDFKTQTLQPDAFVDVPGVWTGVAVNGKPIGNIGYATYRLEIISDTSAIVEFYFKEIISASAVWFNGQKVAWTGTVASEAMSSIPQYQLNKVAVNLEKGKNELVVQISNFNHRANSFEYAPLVGTQAAIDRYELRNYAIDLVVIGFLIIMAFYHLGLFIFRPKNVAVFVFSVFCFLSILRVGVSTNHIIGLIFPNISWATVYFLKYLTLYTIIPVLGLLLQTTFEEKRFKLAFNSLYIVSGLFVLSLCLPSVIYTRLLIYYEIIAIGYFTVVLSGLLIKYTLSRVVGAFIFLLSITLLALATINDMFYFLDVLPTGELVPLGIFVLVLGQALTLGKRFTSVFSKNEQLSVQLDYQNQNLKHIIDERTRELEEEKRKLNQTNQALKKYFTAIEQSHATIVITDTEGNIEYVNPQFEVTSGFGSEEVLGKNPRILKSDKTQSEDYKKLWDTISKGNVWHGEFINAKKSKEEYVERATISPIKDDSGKIVNYIAIKEDITKIKEIEKSLIESEFKYKLLAENNTDVIWTLDMNTQRLTYVSPSIFRLRGLTVEEAMNESLRDSLYESSYQKAIDLLASAFSKLETGNGSVQGVVEFQQRCKNGRIIDIEVSYNLLYIDGKPADLLGVSRDITKRKHTERALKESEEKYRLIAENTSDLIWKVDLASFRYNYFSPSIMAVRGFTVEEAICQSVEESLSPESYANSLKLMTLLDNMKPNEDIHIIDQCQTSHKKGGYIDVEYTASLIRDEDGRPKEILGVSRDISKRKLAERALKESEEKYRLIAENTHDVIWTMDLSTFRYKYVSPSVERIRGYLVDEVMNESFENSLTPESFVKAQKDIREYLELAKENPKISICRRYQQPCKNGTLIDIEVTASFIRNEQNVPIEVIGITRDISERVKIEQALTQSQLQLSKHLEKQTQRNATLSNQLNSIFTNSFTAIGFLIVEGDRIKFSSCNKRWADSLGFTPEEMEGGDIELFCDEDTVKLYTKYINRAIEVKQPLTEYVHWHNMYLYTSIVPIFDEQSGKLLYCACFIYNVTDKYEAELKMLESQEKFQNIFNNSSDGIAVLDTELKVLEINTRFFEIIGISERIAIQEMNVKDYMPERYHDEMQRRFDSLLKGDILPSAEFELYKSDGSNVSVEISSSLFSLNNKLAILYMIRDISIRKNMERTLTQVGIQIENRERRKLATDLHDNVGPLLSSMNMCLSLLFRKPGLKEYSEDISDIRHILKEAIAAVREISNNISPQVLTNYGLVSALDLFFETKRKLISIEFNSNIADLRFSEMKEVMVYNIVKEVFNNSLKYSQSPSIVLTVDRKDNYIHVLYKDNGIGFNLDEKLASASTSLGLFSIFNRVKNLDGNYKIETAPGKGFKLEVIFPIIEIKKHVQN